ncbi:hypothetical protein CHS0354_002828 [Potamilus streckersoni]|uniref:Uncharacterized protein n=1 Tax=Potamilus streckersoni TaxID=2493646 RepID=A0AAE0VFS6_9BIVA|nr:hypothetical protein CHS0354_002828 [Potamilus streckersoni]
MIGKVVCVFVCYICLCGVLGGEFTSYVNVEKLYTLEDELISIADVVIREERHHHPEGEKVHGLEKVARVMEEGKEIHNQITLKNISQFIVHPVNIFHLTKRLVREWHDATMTLRDSKTCSKGMSVKIQNIEDNIPNEEDLSSVAHALVKLQSIYDIPLDNIISGNISDMQAQAPLSLDDMFILARAAYDHADYYGSVVWLREALDRFEKGKQDGTTFNVSRVSSLLGSSYYMLNRPKEAVDVFDKVLKLDPDNKSAERNSKFMSEKLKSQKQDHGPLRKPLPKDKKTRLIEQLCSGKLQKTPNQQSKLRCFYLKTRDANIFSKPEIKGEVMNWDPFVIVFHNFTDRRTSVAIYWIGYDKMKDDTYKYSYQNRYGLQSVQVQDHTVWQWIPRLQERLEEIHLSDFTPARATFKVRNIGMELFQEKDKFEYMNKARIGTFLTFLTDVKTGGDVVFPFLKTIIKPNQGSTVFWESKAHNQVSICPVVGDTEWVGEYPLYNQIGEPFCSVYPVRKPKLA